MNKKPSGKIDQHKNNKSKKRQGKALVFNDDSRKDYVTGMHRRKQERRKQGQVIAHQVAVAKKRLERQARAAAVDAIIEENRAQRKALNAEGGESEGSDDSDDEDATSEDEDDEDEEGKRTKYENDAQVVTVVTSMIGDESEEESEMSEESEDEGEGGEKKKKWTKHAPNSKKLTKTKEKAIRKAGGNKVGKHGAIDEDLVKKFMARMQGGGGQSGPAPKNRSSSKKANTRKSNKKTQKKGAKKRQKK